MEQLKNKNIVVTGGAGFIGSHLCEKLIELGSRVICVDNLLTGKLSNIKSMLHGKRFKFLFHNVVEDLNIDDRIFAVLHFASPASPMDYLKYPIQTLKVGSLGTHKMIGIAKKHKARFLLASTSEVYGDPLIHPQQENYWGNVNPIGPRGVYDEAKRFAEAMVMAYYRTHKVNVKIARIFNTYGPRMRPNDGRAIPAFISQALKNKPVTVFGKGNQTRSFCFISDQVDGLLRLLLSDATGPINIGNPHEMSVKECAERVIKACGSNSKILFKGLPIDDPKNRQPDIYQAKEKLGWSPKVSFDEGILHTINWFKR